MTGGAGTARCYFIASDFETDIVFVSGDRQRPDMQTAGRSRTDLAAGVAFDTVESVCVGPGPGGINHMTAIDTLRQGSTGDFVIDRPATVEVIHRCVGGQSGIEMTFTATATDIGGICQMLCMTPVSRWRRMTDGAIRRSGAPGR